MLLYMLFFILCGMLLGLVLLTLNFELLLQKSLAICLFCWEKSVVQFLLHHHLLCHRPRNRQTTLLYSTTLAFIIFLSVSSSTHIQATSYQSLQSIGASMVVRFPYFISMHNNPNLLLAFERVAIQDPHVESFGWISHELGTIQ